MNLSGLITRALLFLALLGSATVPDGFMRAQGPDGLRLVLCTPDGTQEVWLTDEGDVIPVEDDHPAQGHDGPHCVQVSVAGLEAAPNPDPLIRLPLWPMAPPRVTAQRPVSQIYFHHNRSRAPPFPV
ncbi:MAG: hypothetical protein MRY75_17970 [Marivita sp.]|uniref:DUF2946 family protein n=1 Tax=Marivita sp. TaxID=2003365 RepID=UPI0025C5BAA1|nr:DUF2946 family protein [Marivita sp.]MCI5112436.1 hypothetical protein [Marivita sp.]